MSCCHTDFALTADSDKAFTVGMPTFTFGAGCLAEAGGHAQDLGLKRVALFTDGTLARSQHLATVMSSLSAAQIDVAIYDEVMVEPTTASFQAASRFAAEGKFDGYVSVGGGSVLDTCKAANLYATYPAEFMTYVNAPIGAGQRVPGALRPHIACPTTSGTGSEMTGISIFNLTEINAKTGIISRRLIPTVALIDPNVTATLPKNVVASSGFDCMSHALESLTARAWPRRLNPARGASRPVSQGANPFSDGLASEALRAVGKFLVRAVSDAADIEARTEMMYAAMQAGIAFNAAGCHPDGTLGERHDPETHLIPILLKEAVRVAAGGDPGATPVVVNGDDYDTPDGTCVRDYVHVMDLATAHLAAAERLVDGRDVGIAGNALAAVGERVDAGLAVLVVELVLDLADDLFEHVFDGDQPGGVAELVDHDREVVAVGAEVAQQLVQVL